MSDLLENPCLLSSKDCQELLSKISQKLPTRTAHIGEDLTIRRALPHKNRKTIGAWCFLDHFGPLDLKNSNGLNIGPHPHMGLQTFTYLMNGEILHRDSLGSKQVIRPGQVNLMTAGKGISHSEESLPDSMLHGVQLWIALPDSARFMAPNFSHYADIPTVHLGDIAIHVLVGEFLETNSPVEVHTPLVGLELHALNDTSYTLPLNPAFEYGILPLNGTIQIGHESIDTETMLYLASGQSHIPVHLKKGSRILIVGGEPFKEEILIWWNFVARTKDEMIEAVHAWNHHTAFGEVKGYVGDQLAAPELRTSSS